MKYIYITLTVIFFLSQLPTVAQERESSDKAGENSVDLLDISLEDLLKLKVATATKKEQSITKTPAIISVITAKDISTWGYQSVAEALKQVPGLYGINDYVGYNYGIRGINGGQRAYSKLFKLMIDGVAISFRADSTNMLGSELINVDLIERIEVVRGPGSALYGENAFLGVVNVITKEPQDVQSKTRVSFGNFDYRSASFAHSAMHQNLSLTTSISHEESSTDGMQVSSSSPASTHFQNAVAQNSHERPLSVYAKLGIKGETFSQEFLANYSRIDSIAEFLDFGTLSHQNRVAAENRLLAYRAKWLFSDNRDFQIKVTNTVGKPDSREKLSLNSDLTFPRRSFESNTWEVSGEYHFKTDSGSNYILGVDFSDDKESLLQIFSVNAQTGAEVLLTSEAEPVHLKNIGIYLQYLKQLDDSTLLTLNVRNDDQNVYGSNSNYRIGLVQSYSSSVSVKYLLGTSYKAPAAMQLFAQPLYPGEVIGNDSLLPEEAVTLESELTWIINKELGLSVNLWVNEIDNKVELLPFGPNVQPQNSGEQYGYGFESELKWIKDKNSFTANIAFQETENRTERLFQADLISPTAMFPKLTSFIRFQRQINEQNSIGFSVEYASERRATNSNIRENLFTPYQLSGYTLANLNYVYLWSNWQFNLRVNNLFDEDFSEPGFGGIDIPGRPRSWRLSLSYEF